MGNWGASRKSAGPGGPAQTKVCPTSEAGCGQDWPSHIRTNGTFVLSCEAAADDADSRWLSESFDVRCHGRRSRAVLVYSPAARQIRPACAAHPADLSIRRVLLRHYDVQ